MGVFHRATLTPSKAELVSKWIPTQSWGPSADARIEVVGAFRIDDPENRVGMETHIAMAEGELLHVPLTYRDAPVAGAEANLVAEMHHSELGTRWVYDGLSEDLFVTMLAAVTMTGQGEALGMANYDGRWNIAPAAVRIQGGGWTLERVPVDGFRRVTDESSSIVFNNDRFELTVHRRPVVADRPAMGLTAPWAQQPDPVLLAQVREL